MESPFDLMDPETEAMEDELGASYGDPRVCPRHPHVQTSSADGMFDAPCGECEWEADRARDDASGDDEIDQADSDWDDALDGGGCDQGDDGLDF